MAAMAGEETETGLTLCFPTRTAVKQTKIPKGGPQPAAKTVKPLSAVFGSFLPSRMTISGSAASTTSTSGQSARKTEKLNYIHHNPVKRGLVSKPDQWVW